MNWSVRERLDQLNARVAAERRRGSRGHRRVRMYGKQQGRIRMRLDERRQNFKGPRHVPAETFAPMCRDDDPPEPFGRLQEPRDLRIDRTRQDRFDRIDDGIARDEDPVTLDSLAHQRAAIRLRRGEVIRRQAADQPPIHLFREGASGIPGSKSRLHMSHGDAAMKSRERAGHRRRRIALDQEQRRRLGLKNRIERREEPGADSTRMLGGFHDAQVVVHPNVEELDEGIDEGRVLTRQNVQAFESTRRAGLERSNDGRQLDDLGARTEQRQDFGRSHQDSSTNQRSSAKVRPLDMDARTVRKRPLLQEISLRWPRRPAKKPPRQMTLFIAR